MSLPSNVHVSSHPCVRAKLSQLRSQNTHPRDVHALVNDIATLVGAEALAEGLEVTSGVTDKSPLGYEFDKQVLSSSSITIVPILRSGLSMVSAISSILPEPVPIHHLGMYREKVTLQPVEYYNNLPYHKPSDALTPGSAAGPAELAIIVDPIIATGATAAAAIDTLKEWGVKRVIVVGILGSVEGLQKAAQEWENVSVYVGGCDNELDERGMIKPGIGDIGDRLYLTIGK